MAKKQPESSKTKAAKRQQAASDKTFGLKNKNKSSKVQAYVKQVEEQVANAAQKKKSDAAVAQRAAEKKAAEQAKLEALKLFQPVQTQKVPFGVDPKTVLCAFFKQGMCTKGSKCKFSHNLDVGRKSEKRDLYADEKDKKDQDTMENWDEEKLKEVVMSKHGNPKTTTDIICKYFIDAVENCKYGWFWQCPNGESCKYRHSLPPGFKLKTKEEQRLERENNKNKKEISIEEFIEIERQKLPQKLTPVTLESFTKWKQERADKKKAEAELEAQKKKAILSGKQLLDSGKFVEEQEESDDEGAWDLSELRRRAEEVYDEDEVDGIQNGTQDDRD